MYKKKVHTIHKTRGWTHTFWLLFKLQHTGTNILILNNKCFKLKSRLLSATVLALQNSYLMHKLKMFHLIENHSYSILIRCLLPNKTGVTVLDNLYSVWNFFQHDKAVTTCKTVYQSSHWKWSVDGFVNGCHLHAFTGNQYTFMEMLIQALHALTCQCFQLLRTRQECLV